MNSYRVYADLLSAGVLEPLQISINNCHEHEEGTKHFVPRNGMSYLVKHFINKSECQPEFEHHISSIIRKNEQWYNSNLKNYKKEIITFIAYKLGVFQPLVERQTYLM